MNDIFFEATLITVLGLVIGSFLNVVIHRLPKMLEQQWHQECVEFLALSDGNDNPPSAANTPAVSAFNLMRPGSHCPHCKTPIHAWHNIPILGYCLLRGRCRQCRAPIGLRYPFVEALTGGCFFLAWWLEGSLTITTCALVLYLAVLIALSVIDADTYLLPDDLTLPLLWGGLLINSTAYGLVSLTQAVWGAMLGYLVLWSIFWLYKLLTGKDGMGYGDFKLLAAIGAWSGSILLFPVIMIASLLASIIGLLLIVLAKRSGAKPLPFGPYLALGGAIAVLFHGQLQSFVYAWVGMSV